MDLNTDVGVAIFATNKAFENLWKLDTIICDGTIKTAPFDQIHEVLTVFGERKATVCWALLKGKQ